MALTPNEILNKEFNSKFRGYDTDQVNDYLDIIVADFEKLINENNQLKQDLAAAKEKNEYFAQLQDSLNSSIVVAQEAADRLKQNARKEAELILYEAEREADRMINNASDTAKNIVTESDALRRSSKSYRTKLEQMIRNQLEVVTSEEYHRLFDEELDSKFEASHFHEAANQRVNERVDRLESEDSESFEAANQITHDRYLDETPEVGGALAPDYPNNFNYHDTEDLGETKVAMNREEFRAIEDIGTENNELDHDELDVDDFNNVLAQEAKEQEEREKRAKQRRESVLGQTIRIELPKDE
ncbi:DivIVA domain-containing protein [Aerococcaceae bacterium WGS1372]